MTAGSVLNRLGKAAIRAAGRVGVGRRSLSAPMRTIAWIAAQELPTGGIRVHHASEVAYPEVSGYVVPTLLGCGCRDLAVRMTEWLVCIQRRGGGYADPDQGVEHIFDTGQVLRGLLAAWDDVPAASRAAVAAGDFLLAGMREQGAGGYPPCYEGQPIPETVLLYTLPPLVELSARTGETRFASAANAACRFYQSHDDLLQASTLTHFLAYEIEALLDMGVPEPARAALEALARRQHASGAVPATDHDRWVCMPGQAQAALCWYKAGMHEPADRAMQWMERHQDRNGGFCGSIGCGAAYFQSVQIPWAAKYFLDAAVARVDAFIAAHLEQFPDTIDPDDGRFRAVSRQVQAGDRVLEIGCGKGRFLKALADVHDGLRLTGVDLSAAMLAYLPPSIPAIRGPQEAVPLPDDAFDVVFSVEALEHTFNMSAAVGEMARLVRPGGRIIIVDKERSAWGRLRCPPWETWPSRHALARLLRVHCDDVTVTAVGHDGRPADGLFMVWQGVRRGALDADGWHGAMTSHGGDGPIIDAIQRHRLVPWARVLIAQTACGDSMLEVGSGTGAISLQAARAGRDVTLLDFDAGNLRSAAQCAAKLNVNIQTVCADACSVLPFPDRTFDLVWSSGLLEHFDRKTRVAMLREQARVSRGKVAVLVPNASSVAYRLGKDRLSQCGEWPYGHEQPLRSLLEELAAAGLVPISERTVGSHHAAAFLRSGSGLMRAAGALLRRVPEARLDNLEQGYLLFSVGCRAEDQD